MNSHLKTKADEIMDPEKFNQVVEAILNGKYSWACVLILRFAGYDPLSYMPYRTYNRLLKENHQVGTGRANRAARSGSNPHPLTSATSKNQRCA
ncbi:MAG: HetP family heterocyst commitment protein [Cyanothece sp. SIO1E1]|nr:HetP family heterocyst commitment protein [Cyanothece sp. SIO1E1]